MEQDESVTTINQAAVTDGLAHATPALAQALANLNGQFAAIHAKIDRIVAAVDDGQLPTEKQHQGAAEPAELQANADEQVGLQNKVAELQKANQELRAQSETARRKTLSPVVTTLLAKEGAEGDALIEGPVVEKALAGLSVEQRIAVKAELARAGILV